MQDWDDTDALMPANHRYVPSAVFTDPPIASVGLTENEARAKGLNIKVKIQDFSDVAYGWAMEDTIGIAKLIVDDDTGLLLGAHIMGHQASSLIQPLIQAMAFDLPAQDMARGQYWIHPALPEVVENALLALCGEPRGRRPDGISERRAPVPSASRPVRNARPPARSTMRRRTARR